MAKPLRESTHLLYGTDNQQVHDQQASLPKARKWYGVVAAMICTGALVGIAWHASQSESIVKDAQVSLRKQNEPVASATNDAYKAFYETTNSYINASADPCDDFYEYACGNWLATHELPSDSESIDTSIYAVMEANNKIIQSIIDTKPPVLGEFYDACVHTTADADKESAAYVANVIKRIHAQNSTFALLSLAGELYYQSGVSSFFSVDVQPDPTNPEQNLLKLAQGAFTLPSHNDYMEKDKADQYAALYLKYVQALFAVGDLEKHNATQYAANVLQTETAFATISLPTTEVRNPWATHTHYTLDEIRRQLPYVSAYLTGVDKHQPIPDVAVIVATLRFFEDQNAVLSSLHLDQLKNYLSFHVMDAFADTLGEYFRRVSHDFHGTLMGSGELKARAAFCVETTTTYLGPQLGEYFMAKVFNADAKAAAQKLVDEIEESMDRLLGQQKWLDEATLVAAREKLHNVRNYIGGPDKVDKLPFEIKSDSFFENVLKLKKLTASTKLSTIGQPVDPTSWEMFAETVNAYFDPSDNKMVFPAAILQPPFYSATAFPPAANFGRIGMVMSHELTHGFDNSGRNYDAKGVLRNWWTPDVSKEFEKRAQCLSEQYSKFAVVSEGQYLGNVDGNLTLGENIADNGGIHLSYQAYQAYKNATGFSPGMSQQEDSRAFFVAYGQLWCEKRTATYSEVLRHGDAHSPGHWRVNGPLMNFDKFAETFQCAAGTRMNPTKKCVVW